MISNILILFFTTLLAGLVALTIPKIHSKYFYLGLVFSGAFLFSITIVHLLPELFVNQSNPGMIGMLILVGFFMQLLLDFFTSGVEHGHLHMADEHHHHHSSTIISLLLALCLHALLEGALLGHPSEIHQHHQANGLLLGIVLHKMPAAFALMTVLLCNYKNKWMAVALLVLFAITTPLGLWLSTFLGSKDIISSTTLAGIFAIVCGNFLHISTTIFFESSPSHSFNAPKLLVALLGALLAVSVEFLL